MMNPLLSSYITPPHSDPSTAKSQLLNFNTRVAPIAVYTSGKGSLAAGLTASVICDVKGKLYLEGGILAGVRNNLSSLLEAYLHHFSQMEGNSTAMTSSTLAPSDITIIVTMSNNSMDHSIVLEMVPDESTIKAAEA
eukprot:2777469-Ditylum_brightwellii.AAC.1